MVWRTCVAQSICFITPARRSYLKAVILNMAWRTCVAQGILFITPARGLIQKQLFPICFGEHVSPNVYLL